MGTDAHSMVEVFQGGEWRLAAWPFWPVDRHTEAHKDRPFLDTTPGIARHYGLFSVLADVRNRTVRMGTAMMKQDVPDYGTIEFEYDMDDGGHEPIQPIDVPRGVPEDANEGWKEFTEQKAIHDPTWLLASEIRESNPIYRQVLFEDCIALEEEYLHWVETGELPAHQARNGGGPGVLVVDEAAYKEGVRGEGGTMVRIRWQGNLLRDDLPTSWWALCAAMVLVAPEQDLTKVRLLVAFDS